MKKTKIYTAYLPQYHATEDNNRFWGEGFTDWVGVRNAKPLFDKHNQPKIPLNNNYYNLSDFKTIQWQADLARKHGVNGFNIYHYWFKDGKQELEKPAELLLSHSEIDIEYFLHGIIVHGKELGAVLQVMIGLLYLTQMGKMVFLCWLILSMEDQTNGENILNI